MIRKTKLFWWLFGGAGILTLLFLALLILAPRIIDTQLVKKRIGSLISQRIGARIEFHKVELSLFPLPVAEVDQIRIVIPGRLTGTVNTLRIYPELMPLLKGEVRISKFQIEAPDLTVSLPEKSAPVTLRAIQDEVASLLSALESRIPGLRAEIAKGSLTLSGTGKPAFLFRDMEGQFAVAPGSAEIGLSGSSNVCERFSLKGKLNPKGFKGEGSVRVDGFLPHALWDYLSPDTSSLLGESKADLNVRFKQDRLGVLNGELEASATNLTLQRGNARQLIRAPNVRATFSLNDEKTIISLTRLSLDAPELDLVGRLEMDRMPSRIALQIEGRDLNVEPLREAVLTIAGDVPIIRQICDIVRGGSVPRVFLQTGGSSVADLTAVKSIVVKTALKDGLIYLRDQAMNLDHVSGEAVISNGILKGEKIEARLGNARGLKGALALGLKGDDPPFNLDVMVQTDLAEITPVLKRLVKDKSFQEEISRIDNLKGNAAGRLFLGKSLSSINVRAEVSTFSLSAGYRRLPHKIEITRGQITYDGFNDTVSLKNLTGKLGTSSFTEMAGRFRYGKDPNFEVLSGKLLLALDEIYPWLTSFQEVAAHLKDIRSAKGFVDVSEVSLQGPPSKPGSWRFDTKGEMKDVSVNTSLFNGPVRVARGKFNVTPLKLSFTDVEGQVMDASLKASGALTQFGAGPLKTDVTLSGTMGAEATRWISKVAKLPADPTLRSPFSISQAHLTLGGEGAARISLQGKLSFENGPNVSMDVLATPEEVTVRDLTIQDKISHAAFALTLGKEVVDLKFSGELNSKTLDGMLVGSELPAQWMKGNLKTRIRLNQPWLSTAEGDMEGREIHFTLKRIGHVDVEHISLQTGKGNVKVSSAVFRWMEEPFSLNGTANVSPKGIVFDMNLSAKTIRFEAVKQAFPGNDEKQTLPGNEKKEVRATGPSGNPPLKGILRIKTDRFTYGELAWEPLHADVSFANEGVSIEINRGALCGLSTPGNLRVSDQGIEMEIRPTALNQDLEPAILCFSDKGTDVTGAFSLNGRVSSNGKSEDFIRSLQGNIKFTARKGQFLYHPVLARVFTFLNVTEVFRGTLPDFSQGGFPYDSISIQGDIRGGKFVFKECIIDGRTVDVAVSGEVDVAGGTLNMAMLVTPFKTVSAIVKNIPLVGYILGGTLLSMPVKVDGELRDPKVSYFSPSQVGSELLAPMERVLKIPFKIIDPFLPVRRAE